MVKTRCNQKSPCLTTQAVSGWVQRACACGRGGGLSGNCTECQRERLLSQLFPARRQLAVSHPTDRYEQEAERVSNQALDPAPGETGPPISSKVHGGRNSSRALPNFRPALGGAGPALSGPALDFFQTRLGYDFGQVRIHADRAAADATESLEARAFTIGHDVWLGREAQPSPNSKETWRLLGHELVHVVQQSSPARIATTNREGEADVASPLPVTERLPAGQVARQDRGGTATERIEEKAYVGQAQAAEAALRNDFPHLFDVLTDEQKESIYAVFRARDDLDVVEQRLSELVYEIPGAGEAYAPENEPEITALRRKKSDLSQQAWKPLQLRVETELLLDRDSFATGEGIEARDESPASLEYKRSLFRRMSAQPSVLLLQEGDPREQPAGIIAMEWGPDRWELPHDGGLVTFEDALQIEAFGLDYAESLIESGLEHIGEIEELAAEIAAMGPYQYEDCTPDQNDEIDRAISNAENDWLPAAISALSATPLDPSTVELLNKHFKTDAPGDVASILENFKSIQTEVRNKAAYECGGFWCFMGTAYTGSDTTVLCDSLFEFPRMAITRTIIHETGHRLDLREDIYCDEHQAEYEKMSKNDAIKNPDTYAAFAGELTGKYRCLDW